MADNVDITPGTGATVGADLIGGVLYQRVKLIQGADGTNDGDVCSAAPLQVALPAATVTTLTPPTSLTAVTTVGTITNAVAVTNAGITSIDGKITACNTGAVTVSNAPVTHVIIDSGNPTTITATQGTAANLKVEATIASAQTLGTVSTITNVVHVDDNSGALTVDNGGTFAVQAASAIERGVATSAPKMKVVAYTASQTGATVVAATGGTTMYITDIVISASAAGTVYLFDDTDSSTAELTPVLSLAANGGYCSNLRKPLVTSAVSHTIKYTSGSGAAGSIWISYYEV